MPQIYIHPVCTAARRCARCHSAWSDKIPLTFTCSSLPPPPRFSLRFKEPNPEAFISIYSSASQAKGKCSSDVCPLSSALAPSSACGKHAQFYPNLPFATSTLSDVKATDTITPLRLRHNVEHHSFIHPPSLLIKPETDSFTSRPTLTAPSSTITMGRRAPIAAMASGLVSNPYAPAKEYVAQTTLCELCNITMKTRDWAAHKNSKKHRAAEKKEFEKNNPPVDGFGDHADGFNTDAHGGFGANPSANTNGGSDGRACFGCGETGHTKRDCPQGGSGGLGGSGGQTCYGCGEEGHQKRDCPQGAGGQACFNCGNVG